MSNLPTSTPSFKFGTAATSAASQPLFGSTTTSTPASGSFPAPSSGSGLFGSSSNTSSQPSSNLFGAPSTTTAPTASLFGAAGAGNGVPKDSNSNAPKPNLFGGGNSTGAGLFSTPNKPSEAKAAGSAMTSGLFGAVSQPGGSNLFGSFGGTSGGTNPPGITTPAPGKPTGAMFSTTPAGPPPVVPAAAGSTSIFGALKPQEQKSGPFGAVSSAQTTTTQAGSNPTSSLFGASQPAAATSSQAPVPPTTNLFGQASAAGGGSLFSLPASTQQDTAPKSHATANTGGLASAPPSSMPPATSSLFGNASKPLATTNSNPSPFSFPPSSMSTGNTNNVLPSSSATQDTLKPSSTSTIGNSLFGASIEELVQSIGAPSSTASAATSAPATAPTTLNMPPGGASTNPTASTAKATDPSGKDDPTKVAGLASSTAGPRPTAQSRLKNKSMDEIITRWASDLSKYQKEFQKQALKVAEWDRSIVENAAKIQKLYADTLEAERATSEVERQLSLVENDQEELESWLSHYEKQVDEIISTQVGQGDSLQGPDQERERTFKLAEKLSDRLEEMGKDLTSMVEEINDASSNLSKSSNADDPLSQIVRILNGHLSQLQQIDQGTAAVQNKLVAAQKASRGMTVAHASNGLVSDAADDFYRSYMGRR